MRSICCKSNAKGKRASPSRMKSGRSALCTEGTGRKKRASHAPFCLRIRPTALTGCVAHGAYWKVLSARNGLPAPLRVFSCYPTTRQTRPTGRAAPDWPPGLPRSGRAPACFYDLPRRAQCGRGNVSENAQKVPAASGLTKCGTKNRTCFHKSRFKWLERHYSA